MLIVTKLIYCFNMKIGCTDEFIFARTYFNYDIEIYKIYFSTNKNSSSFHKSLILKRNRIELDNIHDIKTLKELAQNIKRNNCENCS